MLAREQARCIPRSVFTRARGRVLYGARLAESGGIMLACGRLIRKARVPGEENGVRNAELPEVRFRARLTGGVFDLELALV